MREGEREKKKFKSNQSNRTGEEGKKRAEGLRMQSNSSSSRQTAERDGGRDLDAMLEEWWRVRVKGE